RNAERNGIRHPDTGSGAGHDRPLHVLAWIGEYMLEQEAIELRFRERIGALLLDRILCGDHHEALAEAMRLAVERDLAFLHRFQKCCLSLWRRAVDLVGEQELTENGAGHN